MKILLLIFTIILLSCSENIQETFVLDDLDRNHKIESNFNIGKNKNVERIIIQISGTIDDTAKIGNYLIMPGLIDTSYSHEWYSPSYKINYEPYNANEGELEITLNFIVL